MEPLKRLQVGEPNTCIWSDNKADMYFAYYRDKPINSHTKPNGPTRNLADTAMDAPISKTNMNTCKE